MFRGLAVLAIAACCAHAQDERRITSPNGQLEFRVFVAQSDQGGLSRLAYEILSRGKTVVKTSYLGLLIHNQEPILGQNVGLMSAKTTSGAGYRGLIADYMQNGSIGRRLDLEVRVFDDGVAFRYVVPPSIALDEILIDDELTEFDTAGDIRVSEVPRAGFPKMSLIDGEEHVRTTQLAQPFTGNTPLVCPWRVIAVAPNFSPNLEK